MIRVLQVFGEPLSNGGQESFVMNMYRNIDRTKIQFDFYTPFYCDNENLKKDIIELGGNVYTSNGRFSQEANKKDFIKGLKSFLKSHKYEIVHINSGSIFNLAFGAKIANKSGAKKVIVHSHATGIDNLKYRIIKFLSKKIFLKNATDYLACSKKAAEWKFPKKIIRNNQYKVINNGIELDNFLYNEEVRMEYRKKLNISDKDFVIGNVGRLDFYKNQKFLLDIFEEFIQYEEDAKLVIVGSGPLEDELVKLAKEKGISDKFILLKNRQDVNKILQAMDIFVFPSIFEGLGIAAIEAQAAGLVTICSENLPKEANITDLYKSLKLSEGKEKWAKEIRNSIKYNRVDQREKIRDKGYDATQCAKKLELLYLSNND